MALHQNRKPSPEERKSDRAALLAIRDLHDYKPVNPAHSAEALTALEQALTQAEQEELRLQNALASARDKTTAAAWALRNSILGAKAAVIAQYGPDSNEVQTLGLKSPTAGARRGATGRTPRSPRLPAAIEHGCHGWRPDGPCARNAITVARRCRRGVAVAWLDNVHCSINATATPLPTLTSRPTLPSHPTHIDITARVAIAPDRIAIVPDPTLGHHGAAHAGGS